ncbi:LacI family DNA-binding transcriptional regulator [Actinomadura livida]|uniref:LacI family DNA-binding transcriptional regulator n=1 Tax=Actinomadura livida TaxID=79909 RepID=A0A7W7MWT6_9ACTN|nr:MULTISPECIES: LacI family DNA-binding transcriptional regulator [Actinomadura]MBB4773150.1 LacI family transcriptional regulator [Actinomadura catellatispora]GGU18349.1 LacI family transcriptional regulator [Actinomadura livida]
MSLAGRPTSKDVAQEAGVSQSTVSLVLGGKWAGRVSPATAHSVRGAAERLGYRPNQAARNLRLGTTRTVLLMVPTLSAPFFGPVYTGAARAAARHGFAVVVSTWPDDAVGPADSPFAAPDEAIDGILASSMAVEALGGFRDTPAVMLDSGPAGERVPTVDFGVADGMRAIAAHLAGLGHRRIGHVGAAVDQWTFHARGGALASAVAALPGGVLTRATCAIDVTSAKEAAGRLLDAPDRPTALVCDDDLIAAGAYKAARARGLDIPADLSVTGFDDVLLATALEPELTTVRLPAEELGAQGMATLLDLLSGGRPSPRVLPGELVVRESTAPPGA